MDKWIMVLAITLNGQNEVHAKGLFSSERNCWRWAAMMNLQPQPDWMGRCMTEQEYRLYYPNLPLDADS